MSGLGQKPTFSAVQNHRRMAWCVAVRPVSVFGRKADPQAPRSRREIDCSRSAGTILATHA
jgi:hypothetical protein